MKRALWYVLCGLTAGILFCAEENPHAPSQSLSGTWLVEGTAGLGVHSWDIDAQNETYEYTRRFADVFEYYEEGTTHRKGDSLTFLPVGCTMDSTAVGYTLSTDDCAASYGGTYFPRLAAIVMGTKDSPCPLCTLSLALQ